MKTLLLMLLLSLNTYATDTMDRIEDDAIRNTDPQMKMLAVQDCSQKAQLIPVLYEARRNGKSWEQFQKDAATANEYWKPILMRVGYIIWHIDIDNKRQLNAIGNMFVRECLAEWKDKFIQKYIEENSRNF